jgi:hypothetical protein
MKQVQKSRLKAKYPVVYEALGIEPVKRDKRSPVALEFTKDEIAELYVLAQSYGQDINLFLEDTTLTLAWALRDGIFPNVTSPAELIGNLLIRMYDMRSWIYRCRDKIGEIQWQFESLLGTCRATLLRTAGEDLLRGQENAYNGYPYTKKLHIRRIPSSYWSQTITAICDDGTLPNVKREQLIVKLPGECARYIESKLKRDNLEKSRVSPFLFHGLGKNLVGYSVSKFTSSLLSFYRHKSLPKGKNILESAMLLREEGVKLFNAILLLYAELELAEEFVKRAKSAMCNAVGSLETPLEEALPK